MIGRRPEFNIHIICAVIHQLEKSFSIQLEVIEFDLFSFECILTVCIIDLDIRIDLGFCIIQIGNGSINKSGIVSPCFCF